MCNCKIAEDIISIFKENKVLKKDGNYKKLYSDLTNFLDGLLSYGNIDY